MESIRLPYKNDAFGNPVFARVSWSESTGPKAIALLYHGGGLLVGSSEMIPKPQTEYLANRAFAVVAPNYRLAPQVDAKEAFADCEEAFDWATALLPEIMKSTYGVDLDGGRVVAMGHSSGGLIALHLASCKPVKAVTAFYPSLFTSDISTSVHKPTTAPPFGTMPDFVPSAKDWDMIKPADKQVSEAPLAVPGIVPAARNKWQMHLLKNGQWLPNILPDGNYGAIDPLTRTSERWPPVMIVQGELDDVPGSSLELAQRAEDEMKAAGVKEVQLEVVPGATHMFDLAPAIGTSELGPRWQAVLKGLDWLGSRV